MKPLLFFMAVIFVSIAVMALAFESLNNAAWATVAFITAVIGGARDV